MKINRGTICRIISAFLVITAAFIMMDMNISAVKADEKVHYLAFASDYHSTTGSIENSMTGMPSDTEYVSLIGDMVGARGGDHPEYYSSEILSCINNVFPDLPYTNTSIIWADHDGSVRDDLPDPGIVKCMDGYGACQIFEGENSSYYIYAIGHYEMTEGGEVSANAAAAFKAWVDTVDKTVPVIVLCHIPIQALRGDNKGAVYWNEALNYAATGVEGIVTTDQTASICRNVLFFHGHNHTSDPTEYYYEAGSTMLVQIDDTAAQLLMSGISDEEIVETETYDEELLGASRASGIESNIYYTSLITGYLKTSGNATLVSISEQAVTLTKYNGGNPVSLGTNGATGEIMDSSVSIERFTREETPQHSSVTINKTDQNSEPLDGAVFTLYDPDGNALASYDSSSFTISTGDGSLAGCLPSAGESTALILRETTIPQGYTGAEDCTVEISASESEELTDHVYKRTVTYSITVNGENSVSVVNTKKTAAQRQDSSVTVTKTDQDGEPLDGAVFTLYDSNGEEITSFEGGEFTIGTEDECLEDHLPAAGESTPLLLKEAKAPEGYEISEQEYTVLVSAAEMEELTDDVFVTTTAYTITADGGISLTVADAKKTAVSRTDASVKILKTDENGNPLSGAVFTLYDPNGTEITSFEGGEFSISTDDTRLADYLPADGESISLRLKETKAPAGYDLSDKSFEVVITAETTEKLTDGAFVASTVYAVTIDGETSLSLTNTKTAAKDAGSSSVPNTGDSSNTFAYTVLGLIAALLLCVFVIRRRKFI